MHATDAKQQGAPPPCGGPRPRVEPAPKDLERVQELYDRGLCRQALDLALTFGPLPHWTGPRARILAGRLARNLGGHRLGCWLHVQAFREAPQAVEAQAYFAAAMFERQGPFAAWKWLRRFDREVTVTDDNKDALQYLWSLRARLAALWRDFETAEHWLQRAEQLDPRSPWLFTERAFVLEQQDRYHEALVTAREALEIRPWYRPGIQSTAHALQLLDRDEEALGLLKTASRRLENVPLLTQLANLQMDLERFPEALNTLNAIVALSPLLEKSYLEWLTLQRARVAYHCGDFAQAAEYARQSKDPYAQQLAERLAQPGATGRRVKLPVSFVRQHHLTCAPATLTALSRFWQMPAEHLALAEVICYDGTPAHSERQWAEQHGYVAREFTVTWPAAVALLDRGVPFTLTTVEATNAHLQAVIGYDELRGTLLIRDPFLYYHGEAIAEPFLERYRSTGPRGLAIVPSVRAELLEGLDLPEAPLYDQLYQVQRALSEHQRDTAHAVLEQMQAAAPDHRLTLTARRALAGYDANTPALLESVEALLKAFPHDGNLQLAKLGCLRELARREERLALLETICAQPGVDSVFYQQYAQELGADAREHRAAGYWLRRAIRCRPVDAGNLMGLADLWWTQRDFEPATELYRYAACLEDKKERPCQAYFGAARCRKQTDRALQFLRLRFERFGRRSAQPAITLAEAHSQLDQSAQGFAVLEEALRCRPEDGELLLFAADFHARHGKFEPAEQFLRAAEGRSQRAAALRTRAALARYRSDLKTALALWREVLELEPLSLEAHRAVTLLLAEVEGLAAALRHLEQVCARFPHHFALHRLRVEWAVGEGPRVAEPAIRRLVDIHPADAWTRRELALNLGEQERWPEALAEAEHALQLEPHHPNGYAVRGQLRARIGQTAAALEDYRRAVQLAVDTEFAIKGLVAACPTLAERKEALAFIEGELIRQVVFGPGLLAYYDVARLNLEPEEVLASVRLALKERPDLWQTWSVAIQQLAGMLRLEEALTLAQEATGCFPLVPQVWLDLALVQQLRLDRSGELQALEQALRMNPGWSVSAVRLAGAYDRSGDFERARTVLEHACARTPLEAVLHGGVAEILWKMGQKTDALERVQHALRLNPGYDWAWRALGSWAKELGRPNLAEQMARDLIARRSGEARPWLLLAQTQGAAGNTADALATVNKALDLQPRNIEAHDVRAELLALLQRYDEAAAACTPGLWDHQPPLELRARAAWIEAQRGRLSNAITLMRRVLEENPGHFWGWKELADWLWQKGEHEDAVHAATQMARLAPLNPVPFGYRADLKLRRKDIPGAREDFQRAFQLDPAYAYAGFNLFQLQLEDQDFAGAEQTLQVLQQQVGDDMVTACEVRLLVKRLQARLAGEPKERAGTGSKDRKQLVRCLELLRRLFRSKTEDSQPLDDAVKAVLETGYHDELGVILEEALEAPDVNPHVGALWMQRRVARRHWSYPKRLDRLCERGEVGRRAVIALVSALGEAGKGWRLRWVLWKHRRWLREHPQGWGAVGFALVCLGRSRRAVRWLADWPSRPQVEMWMLWNLAYALRSLGRYGPVREVVRGALALPRHDHTARMFKLWHAAEEALAGRTASAAEQFQDLDKENWTEYGTRLYYLTRGMIRVQQAPPAERRQTFRRARGRVHEAFAGVRFSRCAPALRRDYRRCMWRMARDAGSWLQALRAWWRTVVG